MRRLLKDSRGATAIEYGLIAALIGLAMVGPLRVTLSSGLNQVYRVTIGETMEREVRMATGG